MGAAAAAAACSRSRSRTEPEPEPEPKLEPQREPELESELELEPLLLLLESGQEQVGAGHKVSRSTVVNSNSVSLKLHCSWCSALLASVKERRKKKKPGGNVLHGTQRAQQLAV